MKRKNKRSGPLYEKYPPSEPCSCEVCKAFCIRPGWWTVKEAARAIVEGYGNRMMLEIAPEFTFGVLSPAFKGCEGDLPCRNIPGQAAIFSVTVSVNFTAQNLCRLNAASATMTGAGRAFFAMTISQGTGIHRRGRSW